VCYAAAVLLFLLYLWHKRMCGGCTHERIGMVEDDGTGGLCTAEMAVEQDSCRAEGEKLVWMAALSFFCAFGVKIFKKIRERQGHS
jgi:hypothetical protein